MKTVMSNSLSLGLKLAPKNREGVPIHLLRQKGKIPPPRQLNRVFSIAVEHLPSTIKSPIRLARYGTPVTEAKIARFLHRLGVSTAVFKGWTGFTRKAWMEANPGWSERALEVLIVENLEDIQRVGGDDELS